MSILHRLVRLVVLIVLFALSLAAVGAATTADLWESAMVLTAENRAAVGWSAAALFFLALLFAATGFRAKHREKFLSFDGEEGTVSISTDAVADYIGKLAAEFPSILRMRPKVVPRKKSIDVVVDLRVKAGPQIHEICELLNQRVRETMTNGLGISDIRHVEVSVREIVSEHKQI
jgi:uncharacterized alkaline shock family protein YloU